MVCEEDFYILWIFISVSIILSKSHVKLLTDLAVSTLENEA